MQAIMKTLYIAMFLAFLLVPSSAEVYMEYQFSDEVWKDVEKQGFAVFDRGAEIGEVNVWIKEIEFFDQTAYMVEYLEQSGEYTERTVTKVTGADLRPLMVTKRIEIDDEVWFYEANYTGEDLVLSYTTPESPYKKQMKMTAGINFYPSEILPFLLRNLTFAEGDMYAFTLISTEAMHFQSAIIEVMGDEIVEVPSGIYDCWKVEIRQGGYTTEAWYSKKQPQFLIKYYFGKELGMKNHT